MFTGIIEETGTVEALERGADSARLTIRGGIIFSNLKLGDSVAVNGVCLTASSISGNTFTADVMHETLNRSGLGGLKKGSRVNLERAMSAQGRFGGHIVSGHIDGVGIIESMKRDDNAVWVKVVANADIIYHIVEKGSITVDGISLTVARVGDKSFEVSVIPHTAKETTLIDKKIGDKVNLENDVIGKYVERFLTTPKPSDVSGGITEEFLTQCGF